LNDGNDESTVFEIDTMGLGEDETLEPAADEFLKFFCLAFLLF